MSTPFALSLDVAPLCEAVQLSDADNTEQASLAWYEAELQRVAAEAVRLDLLTEDLRQLVLRACKHAGREDRIRPRTADEKVAKVKEAIREISAVLPRECLTTAPVASSGVTLSRVHATKPRAGSTQGEPGAPRMRLSVDSLRDTLGVLEALLEPAHPAVQAERYRRALEPQPWHPAMPAPNSVLAPTGPGSALRALVLGKVRAGASAGETLSAWCEATGAAPTRALRRRVERLVKKAGIDSSLVDGRSLRAPIMWSCPPLVQALIIKVAFARRGATKAAIARVVGQELQLWLARAREAGVSTDVRAPSANTVGRFMSRWSVLATETVEDGPKVALKANRPVDRYSKAVRPNLCWQEDHVTLDIVVVEGTGSALRVVRPTLSALIDEASGVCVGWVLDTEAPNAFTTSRLLYRALTPWRESGRTKTCCPVTLKHDRGRDFLSGHVERVLTNLGITQVICPPRTPNARPEEERFFRSIHLGCSALAGYIGKGGQSLADAAATPERLLTIDGLRQHLEDWTLEFNTSVHRGETMSPMQAWTTSLGPVVPQDLAWRLLRSDIRRIIRREGIEFDSRLYKGALRHPDGRSLTELIGTPVRVYSTPDYPERIWVTVWEGEGSTGREEVYLGAARVPEPGVPSLDMEEVFGETRNDVRAIAKVAKSITAHEDRERQARAMQAISGPVLNLVEHRTATNAKVAEARRSERAEQARHAALLRAPALSFAKPNSTNPETTQDDGAHLAFARGDV